MTSPLNWGNVSPTPSTATGIKFWIRGLFELIVRSPHIGWKSAMEESRLCEAISAEAAIITGAYFLVSVLYRGATNRTAIFGSIAVISISIFALMAAHTERYRLRAFASLLLIAEWGSFSFLAIMAPTPPPIIAWLALVLFLPTGYVSYVSNADKSEADRVKRDG